MKFLSRFILQTALAASTAHALCLGDQADDCCSTAAEESSPKFQPPCTWYHRWEDGETVSSVSDYFSVTCEALEELNCFLDDPNATVKTGTVICLSMEPRKGGMRSERKGFQGREADQLEARSLTHTSSFSMVTMTLHNIYGAEEVSTTELPLPSGKTRVTTTTEAPLTDITSLKPATTLEPVAVTAFMTESCDAGTDKAEDCRVTMDCDKAMGMYPTCDNGICKCLAIPCDGDTACDDYKQCRTDDERPACRSEPLLYPDEYGICACKPILTDCFRRDDPNLYCSEAIRCTEKMFSGYPEYAICDTQDTALRYPLGRCSCHPVDCDISHDKDPWDACEGLVACAGDDEAPYCSSRYLKDGHGRGDGYCSCRPKEELKAKNNGTLKESPLVDQEAKACEA